MLKTYKKDLDVSYSFGVSPTIELLKFRPYAVKQILINPKGESNKGVEKILSLCKELNVQIQENQSLIEKLSGTENTYALGVFEKYSSELTHNSNHIVLAKPSDMGNLGTIARTMLAFGFKDLVLLRPAVDLFDPKVVRASMGAVFKLSFQYFENFDSYRNAFPRNFYPFMTNGNTALPEAKFEPSYSLIFGNEGAGLGDEFLEVGQSISIPITSEVDSLNLASSVAIALYQASKQP